MPTHQDTATHSRAGGEDSAEQRSHCQYDPESQGPKCLPSAISVGSVTVDECPLVTSLPSTPFSPTYLSPKLLFCFGPSMQGCQVEDRSPSCPGYCSAPGHAQTSVGQGPSSPQSSYYPARLHCTLPISTIGKMALGSSFLHLAGHHTPYPAYPTSHWPIRNVLSIPAKKLLPKGQQPTLSPVSRP